MERYVLVTILKTETSTYRTGSFVFLWSLVWLVMTGWGGTLVFIWFLFFFLLFHFLLLHFYYWLWWWLHISTTTQFDIMVTVSKLTLDWKMYGNIDKTGDLKLVTKKMNKINETKKQGHLIQGTKKLLSIIQTLHS